MVAHDLRSRTEKIFFDSINIISESLGRISCFVIGLVSSINFKKFCNIENGFIYLIGIESLNFNFSNSFFVFQGSFDFFDFDNFFLVLPSSIFTESFNFFLNIEGRYVGLIKLLVLFF